ncbi:unnamed protein product [Rotaria magnacalcarata]|uniref:Uncharacterized protein n=1 Tax=Rotaria magnacalcarata TaxID=392030 RepID=A0A819RC15_9BILA|nr:unnamed protein product [Rotaria magnacalcarata]CAF2137190.1 unnamed protein product [Rotaria magnacalcarata]CAF2151527.1 unnamed protein product [Rotaria magnacalcarata]CAF2170255.1 unnamed protein product [Rotaria magnacalcarata]CAF3782496.1 unnamed protein product [Rotaria magnacalcarata]
MNNINALIMQLSNAPRHSSLPFSSLLEDISDEENEEKEDEIFISSLSRRYDTNTSINSITSGSTSYSSYSLSLIQTSPDQEHPP